MNHKSRYRFEVVALAEGPYNALEVFAASGDQPLASVTLYDEGSPEVVFHAAVASHPFALDDLAAILEQARAFHAAELIRAADHRATFGD